MNVDIEKFNKKQCSRCGAPLTGSKYWLCEKCRPITCPIRFDPEVDSKEIIAQKWKEIKQWYKDHPEAQAPWDEWEDNCRKIWGKRGNDVNADDRMSIKKVAEELFNEMWEHTFQARMDEWCCMGLYETMMEAAETLDERSANNSQPKTPVK